MEKTKSNDNEKKNGEVKPKNGKTYGDPEVLLSEE